MHVSQKCQYTLRALFELAKRYGQGNTPHKTDSPIFADRATHDAPTKGAPKIGIVPVSAAEIAEAQAIPPRFLELILQGLKESREVESRRGNNGGYVLAVPPQTITVGDVIRSVDGTLAPVKCVSGKSFCPMKGKCVFLDVWRRARDAVEEVYDSITLQDLIEKEQSAKVQPETLEYVI